MLRFLLHSFLTLYAAALSAEPILWDIRWSPDGSQFVVAGENTLRIYEREGTKPVAAFPKQASDFTFTHVAWTKSGKQLAATDQKGKQSGIFDSALKRIVPLEVDGARGLSWSPDFQKLATTSAGDGHLRIWARTGKQLFNNPRHRKNLTGVAWSPDGKQLVAIGAFISLRDETGKVVKSIQHRPEAEKRLCLLLSVAWHPSGEFFAIGDYGNNVDDAVIQYWSAEGKHLKNLPLVKGREIRNLSWSKDGSFLASSGDKLRIWSEKGSLKHSFDSEVTLWGVDWSPDGKHLLTSSGEGRIQLWDTTSWTSQTVAE